MADLAATRSSGPVHDLFRVTYRLHCPANMAAALAEDIALEQSVEVPSHLISDEIIRCDFMGRVSGIVSTAEEIHLASIEYPAHLASGNLSQALNLLFGNVSLKPGIQLSDVEFPESFLSEFSGPKLGIGGLRAACNVWGRPLLATAIKPKGSSISELARIAGQFAEGGGDLVKDDHNLVDRRLADFQLRVDACQSAVSRHAKASKACLYFPNLSGTLHDLEQQAAFCVKLGIKGVLVAPMIAGLETIRHLAESFPLAILAHPTMSGSFLQSGQGISHALWLSTFMRLCGCDGTVFPNSGGRFTFTKEECLSIAAAARQPLGRLKDCFPAPAGGMSFHSLEGMAADYGPETIFLVGGGLLGYSNDLVESTGAFRTRIEELFPDSSPAVAMGMNGRAPHVSACEIPVAVSGSHGHVSTISSLVGTSSAESFAAKILKFLPQFRWEGREVTVYKQATGLPFAHVDRMELIGKFGESTAFDIRYFEIAPGGYSSCEKHFHTHVIIPIRGVGQLECQGATMALETMDIAYVPPLAVHQLTNISSEPFGFLCIVDHDRDTPMAP